MGCGCKIVAIESMFLPTIRFQWVWTPLVSPIAAMVIAYCLLFRLGW
jgi:hypothetical protein